jgi:hypothetical protein
MDFEIIDVDHLLIGANYSFGRPGKELNQESGR